MKPSFATTNKYFFKHVTMNFLHVGVLFETT